MLLIFYQQIATNNNLVEEIEIFIVFLYQDPAILLISSLAGS